MAPKKSNEREEEEKGQKKKPTKIEKEGKRKKKKRTKVGYGRYIYKVMKQVHPDMGISSKAMTILDNLMGDMFERIAEAAATLSKYVGRTTLSSREIQGAVKMVLPGELGKHAIAEGTKAVVSYVTAVAEKNKSKTK
uniref:Late histone H2B.L4-like n=1 Tax=Nicotiana tabacum TaxID=4097 RepID=A0A1S3YVV8_TOBAC|nr:PREDICTED: late histone H2B.L4-like [Nicotiana tabacum]